MKVSITDEATTSFTLFEGINGALVVWSEAIRYRLSCQSRDRRESRSGSKLRPEFMLVAVWRQREAALRRAPVACGDHSPRSSWISSMKLITTTTEDPAIPAKNKTSISRMKKMATTSICRELYSLCA